MKTPRRCTRRPTFEALERRLLLSASLSTYVPTALTSFGPDSGSKASIVVDGAGNIFGVTATGGPNNKGTVFEIAAHTSTPITLASFIGVNGANPFGQLLLDAPGNIYGVTSAGGANGKGSIFEVVAGSNTIATLASFTSATGRPTGALAVSLDAGGSGTLWGTTSGGINQGGAVVQLTLAIGVADLSVLQSFPRGLTPGGSVALEAGGNLFGVTVGSLAEAFELPAGGVLHFSAPLAGATAGRFAGGVVLDSSGDLFATTTNGGASHVGGLWQFGPALDTATLVASFNAATGKTPTGTLAIDAAGDLFGVTNHGAGGLWEWGRGAAVITSTASLNKTSGQTPTGSVALFGDQLYGLASAGGTSHAGTVFAGALTRLAITPPPAAAVGALGTITVSVQDPLGNLIASDNSTVTFALSGGTTLGGTTTVWASGGSATFSDLTITRSGVFSLTATDGAFAPATTTFTLLPGVATHLAFVQEPVNQRVGINFPLTVAAEDQFGNVVTTENSSITVGVAAGLPGGALAGTTTLAPKKGIATFKGLALQVPGTYALSASDATGLVAAASDSFTIAGSATQIVFTQQPPATGTAGLTFTVAATLEDAHGNVVTGDHSSVSLVIATGPNAGAVLGSQSASNGVVTFRNITWKTAGTFTLRATNHKATPAISSAFTINPGAATRLQIASVFSGGNPLTAFLALGPVVVNLLDAFGNVVANPAPAVTLPAVSGGVGWVGTGTLNAGDTVSQINALGSIVATGIYLGTDGANFRIQVSNGTFNTSGTITDTSTSATLIPQGPTTAASTSVGTTVTLTYGPRGVPASALSATAALTNGVATFTGLTTSTTGFFVLTASASNVTSSQDTVYVQQAR